MPRASAAIETRPPSRNLQRVYEALSFRAQQIRRGNKTIGEDDFGSIARPHAEFVFFLPGRNPGFPFSKMKADIPFDPLALSVTAMATHHVGVVAIRRERFRAVDDPAAIFSCGDGSRPSRVGPGFGLGQRPASRVFALRERNHVLSFVALHCQFVDVIRAERVVGRDDEPDGAVDPSQLFDHHHVLDVAEARAAVFFWKNDSEQSHLAELRDQFGRKREASSHSITWGAISDSANSRTLRRSAAVRSVKEKSTGPQESFSAFCRRIIYTTG